MIFMFVLLIFDEFGVNMERLNDVLRMKTVSDLKYICDSLGISYRSSARKSEIMESVYSYLINPDVMDMLYTLLYDDEISAVKSAENDSEPDRIHLDFLDELGYLHIKDFNDVRVSDVLAEYLDKAHPVLEGKRKEFNMFNDYLYAFSVIYGIISIKDAVDLINGYENKKLTVQDLEARMPTLVLRGYNYCFVENDIVNNEVFFAEEEYFAQLKEAQRNKPLAVLGRDMVMNYVTPGYVEITPQYKKLLNFFSYKLGVGRMKAEEILEEVAFMCREQVSADFIFECLEDYDVEFESMKQFDEFVSLYMDLNNNTRSWENKGNTPSELRERLTIVDNNDI